MNRMSAKDYQRTIVKAADEAENPYDKSWIPVENHGQIKKHYLPILKTPRKHEEDDITEAVTQYLEALQVQGKVVVFSHIPQETFTKSWATKNKNKRMGVRSGVPDMLIVFPEAVLFLELKRIKGGVLSDSQKKWLSALTQVRSKNQSEIYAGVAYGFDDAQSQIDALLD
jgi:hypothetical protein